MRGLIAPALAAICALCAAAAADDARVDPLPPEQVFVFSAEMDGRTARAALSMPEEYYVYRDRFVVAADTPGFSVTQTRLPPAIEYDDPFFGATGIYERAVTLEADIAGDGAFELKIISQGCDRLLGVCYPPQTHVAALTAGGKSADSAAAADSADSADSAAASADWNSGLFSAAAAAQIIENAQLWKIMAAFFGFGLLLSFTPCVLPMVPILLGVIGGVDGGRRRALSSVAAYVGGVCVSYTALGIAAGLSGSLLAPILQQPPVLLGSSAVLLALAASMFGGFDIRPPSFIARRAGGGGGAFMMGALSAAIVSPCVAAPLIGALIYIGGAGDAIVGGAALFALSLGMSAPLIAAGAGGAHFLPRAGAWSADVKLILGALLCGAAAWISSPLMPPPLTMMIYGALAVFCGVVLFSAAPRGIKAAGAVAFLWGGALIVGAAGGGGNPLTPLSAFIGAPRAAPAFAPIQSPAQLRQTLAQTTRPAMLEFYADWCVSCKEMEAFTFADERVRERMQKLLLLRADVTADDEDSRALLRTFGIYGPPAILFFAPGGALIPAARVDGYQPADEFLRTLSAAGI